MHRSGLASCATAVLALACSSLWQDAARAQFGAFANLPDDDFTWRWGEQRGSRIDDFSIRGGEQSFLCTLTGELSARSRLTRTDLRNFEAELRTSLFFIVDATNAMNQLDRQRDLAWAVLDCVKQGDDEQE